MLILDYRSLAVNAPSRPETGSRGQPYAVAGRKPLLAQAPGALEGLNVRSNCSIDRGETPPAVLPDEILFAGLPLCVGTDAVAIQ